MTDKFKNPVEYLTGAIPPATKQSETYLKHSLERIYRTGDAVGEPDVMGPFWIGDCVKCDGDGYRMSYLLWFLPMGKDRCPACDGLGRVICGERTNID